MLHPCQKTAWYKGKMYLTNSKTNPPQNKTSDETKYVTAYKAQ